MTKMISTNLSNEQIVIVALWWLRGEHELADIEDVAMSADAVTPGRFRWRKYPDQINIQTVGKALRDAKMHGMATGTSARGWMLTDAGTEVGRALAADAPETQARRALTSQQKAWLHKEKTRLLAEEAFKKVASAAADTVTERELLRFFRLDDYIVGETRTARISRITHSFSDDPVLGVAVKILADRIPR